MRLDLHIEEELREIVREEVARALEVGGAGGYLSTKSAAAYLDKTPDAINSLKKRGELKPIRPGYYTQEECDRYMRGDTA